MANQIDTVFAALADPTRRAVVEALSDGPAPVKALAEPHDMALPSFLRHIEVLERAKIVVTAKHGRQRIVALDPVALAPAEGWLDRQKRLWQGRLDRLEQVALRTEAESNPLPGKDRS